VSKLVKTVNITLYILMPADNRYILRSLLYNIII